MKARLQNYCNELSNKQRFTVGILMCLIALLLYVLIMIGNVRHMRQAEPESIPQEEVISDPSDLEDLIRNLEIETENE